MGVALDGLLDHRCLPENGLVEPKIYVVPADRNAIVDAWHRRGLMGGMIMPPALSPIRMILIPLGRTVKDFIKA